MKEFSFSVPQEIIVGKGSLARLSEAAEKLGGKHGFIISGPHLNKMGIVASCSESLENAGIKVDAYTETEGNPSVETVEKAAAAFCKSGADFIIALGGGSPMDVAKAVGVVARYGGSITEYEGGGRVPGDIIPLIAIPTTAGTGSEVTAFSWARLGDVHAMSHPVSAYFDVPHGVANAILLPTIVEYNALADRGKYLKLFNYISLTPASEAEFEPFMLVDLLTELNEQLGIPGSLGEVGVTADKFDAMADDAMKSGNIAVNPRSTTKKDVLSLYEKAL